MSAGKGLKHEEHNVGEEDSEFLQIWIEPKLQNVEPRYQRRHFPGAKKKYFEDNCKQRRRPGALLDQSECKTQPWLVWGRNGNNVSTAPWTNAFMCLLWRGNWRRQAKPSAKRDAIGFGETGSIKLRVEQEAEFIVIEVPVNHWSNILSWIKYLQYKSATQRKMADGMTPATKINRKRESYEYRNSSGKPRKTALPIGWLCFAKNFWKKSLNTI